ncbi:MAG TPA: hypothetical protein VGH82_16080 [Gaiellaceae bacterium]|jgi:hypothetical protein
MNLDRIPGARTAADLLRGRRPARLEQNRVVTEWEQAGRPIPPPPEVKQHVLLEYTRRYGLGTFVETGTFLGDTAAAMEPHIDRLVTIEISPELAARARERFAAKRRVRIIEGDSGRVLPAILDELREPALFWLDGHFSGGITGRGDEDTPVRTELRAVLDHPLKSHVILIDDARDFTGGDYPTLEEVAELVRTHGDDYSFDVRDDIIRLTPLNQDT